MIDGYHDRHWVKHFVKNYTYQFHSKFLTFYQVLHFNLFCMLVKFILIYDVNNNVLITQICIDIN